MTDPTEPIRDLAASFPLVDEGTACTQASFKACRQGFLYIGPQGGRYKAMFKLDASRQQAEQLAADRPDDFQVGSSAWVTARFSAEKPLPKRLWQKWLKESYNLAIAGHKTTGTGAKAGKGKAAAPRAAASRPAASRGTKQAGGAKKKKAAARKSRAASGRSQQGAASPTTRSSNRKN